MEFVKKTCHFETRKSVAAGTGRKFLKKHQDFAISSETQRLLKLGKKLEVLFLEKFNTVNFPGKNTSNFFPAIAEAKRGDIATVMSSLLREGTDIDNNQYALMLACIEGDFAVVKLLLEKGAKVNLQREDGWSSLMVACENGHVDVANLLLENGAKVDLQAPDGWSSLMLACKSGHVDVAKLLLEKGAKVDLQGIHGRSSLMWACEDDHVDVAKLLLEKGAKVDLQDNRQQSSLMLVCENGHVDMAKLL